MNDLILEPGHHYYQVWYVDALGQHGQHDRSDYGLQGAKDAIKGFIRAQRNDPPKDRSRFFVVRVDYTQVTEPKGGAR
jgi:hypothetical protein